MDNQFTLRLQEWLNTPPTERDILSGAIMLLQLNRNRILFANIFRAPQQYAKKLESELRKHLRIRLDGFTADSLSRYESETFTPIRQQFEADTTAYRLAQNQALQGQGIDPDFATETERESITNAQPRGRRADHDALPSEIQQLYTDNGTRYVKMRRIYETLLRMVDAPACDRYELLKMLVNADTAYRRAWEEYDNYPSPNGSHHSEDTATDENTNTEDTTLQ